MPVFEESSGDATFAATCALVDAWEAFSFAAKEASILHSLPAKGKKLRGR